MQSSLMFGRRSVLKSGFTNLFCAASCDSSLFNAGPPMSVSSVTGSSGSWERGANPRAYVSILSGGSGGRIGGTSAMRFSSTCCATSAISCSSMCLIRSVSDASRLSKTSRPRASMYESVKPMSPASTNAFMLSKPKPSTSRSCASSFLLNVSARSGGWLLSLLSRLEDEPAFVVPARPLLAFPFELGLASTLFWSLGGSNWWFS